MLLNFEQAGQIFNQVELSTVASRYNNDWL